MNIREAPGTSWLMSAEAYEIGSMDRPGTEECRRETAARLKRPECRVFVCSEEGKNVGFIALEAKSPSDAGIREIAVREDSRRRGVGSFMIRAAALYIGADTVSAEADPTTVAFYVSTGFSACAFPRHFPDGDVTRYDCTLLMDTLPGLEIHPTEQTDLENVRALWADGENMKFVGFPEGIAKTPKEMEKWLDRINSHRPEADHYSIYYRGVYCGESFYSIDRESGLAALDIKLFPYARGRGIASEGLRHAMDRAFECGAEKCYVDPNPENAPAIALYRRVGMRREKMPEALYNADYPGFLYFEIDADTFRKDKMKRIAEGKPGVSRDCEHGSRMNA